MKFKLIATIPVEVDISDDATPTDIKLLKEEILRDFHLDVTGAGWLDNETRRSIHYYYVAPINGRKIRCVK